MLAGEIFGETYRGLLARARIVFNRSIRSECNCRAFEATAAGALLFQEAGNREIDAHFQKGKEYVAYDSDNLETLLTHYLEHEKERCEIASAGQQRAQEYSYALQWERTLPRIAAELDALPSREVLKESTDDKLDLRSWQALHCLPGADPGLVSDLLDNLKGRPRSALLHHHLAISLAHAARIGVAADASEVIAALRRSILDDPTHVMGRLNLAEVLAETGQLAAAVEEARQALTLLQRSKQLSKCVLDAPHLPVEFDNFRVEWERAAWSNVGQPAEEACAKHTLLRWRIHALLASLTGELSHYYEAAAAQSGFADEPLRTRLRAGASQSLLRSGSSLTAWRRRQSL